ncbi:hypothetical protein ACKWTF_008681 [Chironomus riparius]
MHNKSNAYVMNKITKKCFFRIKYLKFLYFVSAGSIGSGISPTTASCWFNKAASIVRIFNSVLLLTTAFAFTPTVTISPMLFPVMLSGPDAAGSSCARAAAMQKIKTIANPRNFIFAHCF